MNAAAPAPQAAQPWADSVADTVLRIIEHQKALDATLRELADKAGPGPWRQEFMAALEKCDAARFWACEGIRRLEQLRGRLLIPAGT